MGNKIERKCKECNKILEERTYCDYCTEYVDRDTYIELEVWKHSYEECSIDGFDFCNLKCMSKWLDNPKNREKLNGR